jgi:uncharacterized repeat protein (TIGR02543 family)
MSAAKSVTATFARNDYVLDVVKPGPGTGSVTSSPAGIVCDAQCSSASFPFRGLTTVVLVASPVAPSTFAGWTGACTGTGTCSVLMDRSRNVTATFSP